MRVLVELKMDVSDEMSAASTAARSTPRNACGRRRMTSRGNAKSVQPLVCPHERSQISGTTQATSSGNKIRAIIPGNIVRKIGVACRDEPDELIQYRKTKESDKTSYKVHV